MSNSEQGRRWGLKCPRCGRADFEPSAVTCPQCGVTLTYESPPGPPEDGAVKVRLAPIIRQALSSRQPGEDFDEALLRALKAEHSQHASALLSACTGLIEIEAKRAAEDPQQTITRLAQSDPGPEITLRTSTSGFPSVTTEATVIRVGDKEYGSMDEAPPHIRRAIEGRIQERKPTLRIGCGSILLGGWLLALLRLGGKWQ